MFSFPHFYNNGKGQPEAKYLLFNKKQESVGTISIKTTYDAVPAPAPPKVEEKKSTTNTQPAAAKVEEKKKEEVKAPASAKAIGGEGVLYVNVKNSTLTRDADVFTKMDPFCEFDLVGLPPQ